MSDTFNDTQLAIISLVMNQQADEYDDKTKRQMRQIATEAREAMSTNEGDA